MKRARGERNPEISISFLDVITCGFGAIILLLMIAQIGDEAAVDPVPPQADGRVAELQRELFTVSAEVKRAEQEMDKRKAEIARMESQAEGFKDRLNEAKEEVADQQLSAKAMAKVAEQLATAKQKLSDEQRRLLAAMNAPRTEKVGGVPVDSEYIIFIIDTSASMFRYSWNTMTEQMFETLQVYPKVKGLQIMNDMGQYMFTRYAGQWIPDTPTRRAEIINRLRSWNAFSNSSPIEGITAAIRTFWAPDKKISLYVFGDEFTGDSVSQVIDQVAYLNRADARGNLRVRIHGVGFPVQFANPPRLQATGFRYAMLMRELTRQNGGTFVALNEFR